MIRETDAVLAARRETWAKARDAALAEARGFRSPDHPRMAFHVVCAIEEAACKDGVVLDRVPLESNEPSP